MDLGYREKIELESKWILVYLPKKKTRKTLTRRKSLTKFSFNSKFTKNSQTSESDVNNCVWRWKSKIQNQFCDLINKRKNVFKTHDCWLIENEIKFELVGCRWMLMMIRFHKRSKNFEKEWTSENVTHIEKEDWPSSGTDEAIRYILIN